MGLAMIADNYLIVRAPCGCEGEPECECVDGKHPVGEVDLSTLLRNLAVAGALTRAFRLGDVCGWAENEAESGGSALPDPWRPNTEGRAA